MHVREALIYELEVAICSIEEWNPKGYAFLDRRDPQRLRRLAKAIDEVLKLAASLSEHTRIAMGLAQLFKVPTDGDTIRRLPRIAQHARAFADYYQSTTRRGKPRDSRPLAMAVLLESEYRRQGISDPIPATNDCEFAKLLRVGLQEIGLPKVEPRRIIEEMREIDVELWKEFMGVDDPPP